MAVLRNDVWHVAVIDFGCASSRILCIKDKFSKVKVCVVVVYGTTEGNFEERENFWNYLDGVVDRVGNGYRLCLTGNLNGWDGDRVRVGITSVLKFGGKL